VAVTLSAAEPHLLFVIEPAPLYANHASCSRLNLPVREVTGAVVEAPN